MTDEQWDINNNICAITCALGSLIEYPGLITPEDISRLCKVSNRLNDLLIKITERKDD